MANVLVIDTRQQAGKHKSKEDWFAANNIKTVRSKLFIGDYALLHNQSTCIDTKRNLVEVANNLTEGHERFRAECIRAQENGIKLIILVEEAINSREELFAWKSKRTKMTGDKLYKIMNTMSSKYGVVWKFCGKDVAGQTIVELLDKYAGGNNG